MLEIDGRQGEGGGQVLRSALAFSAFTGKSFHIHSIRGGRSKPGLRPQHLAAVKLAADLCGACVQGADLNSSELSFQPATVQPGSYQVDVGTAGSVTLLTQAVLIPALMCGRPVEFTLVGGTDVPNSPPADFLLQVVLPYFTRLGKVEATLEKRGFQPKGQGKLHLRVHGNSKRYALNVFEKPLWRETRAGIVVSDRLQKAAVAERVRDHLAGRIDQIDFDYVQSASDGAVVTLWASDDQNRKVGVARLGQRGLPAEKLSGQVLRSFQSILSRDQPVEEHLADQLVPILAVSGGRIRCQALSPHCLTNIDICSLFTGREIKIDGDTISA